MTFIRRLKHAVIVRLLRRPAVVEMAFEKAFRTPRLVTKAVRNATMRAALLDEISERPGALKALLEHPKIQTQIARHPKFFDMLLARTLRQPEALALALSNRSIRPLLAAQTGFINSIATNPNYVSKILQAVPDQDLPTVATALFRRHRDNVDVPDATTEEFAMSILATATNPLRENRDMLADMLVTHLGVGLKPLIVNLAKNHPQVMTDVLRVPTLRTSIIAAGQVDIDVLADMIHNYIVTSNAAPTPGDRITLLMRGMLDDPAVKRALTGEEELRDLMLAALENAFQGMGSSLQDHLAAARRPQSGSRRADADPA